MWSMTSAKWSIPGSNQGNSGEWRGNVTKVFVRMGTFFAPTSSPEVT
jgi:hypothetical protein